MRQIYGLKDTAVTLDQSQNRVQQRVATQQLRCHNQAQKGK